MSQQIGRGKPTNIEIKAAWEAVKGGELAVAKKMQADGWDISARSVGRCKARGFAPKKIFSGETRPKPTTPEANAINQVKSIAGDAPPELVADATAEMLSKLPAAAADRVKVLLGKPDEEIIASTRKLCLIAGHLLAEDLAQYTKMMMLVPDKAAKLYIALTGVMPPSHPIESPKTVDGGMVVEHDADELSESARAIADFRALRERAA